VDEVHAEPLDSDSVVNRWVDNSSRAASIERMRERKEMEEKTRIRVALENKRKRRIRRLQSAKSPTEMVEDGKNSSI
jgi:hypothetical protein